MPSSRATAVTVFPEESTRAIASRLNSSVYRFVYLFPTWCYFHWTSCPSLQVSTIKGKLQLPQQAMTVREGWHGEVGDGQFLSIRLNSGEPVGQFTVGFHGRGQSGWMVHAVDECVASPLADVLGGLLLSDGAEVITRQDEIPVEVEPGDVALRMVPTGAESSEEALVPQPHQVDGPQCSCRPYWRSRRDAAKGGLGAVPEDTIIFRLVDAPGLGCFSITSSSWNFAASVPHVQAELAQDRGRPRSAASDWCGRNVRLAADRW
ncbi:hypothetical protein GCM10010121_075390 [Streptomyces brasiliensis]|uniref:Uncharacterized protein n=1 Tax=Streptomyces brasiliensis TaxID=1954 RepID=A0A917L927_9ACTN|nr:hypothetical protein GCM10010121_075390 [Streptomyces brasiliensis]